MRIWTSNFSNIAKLNKAGIKPISIAGSSPRFYVGEKMLKLAPSKEKVMAYKNGVISWDQYVKYYEETILNQLSASDIFQELTKSDRDIALLCWCAAKDNCHRKLVARWLNKLLQEPLYKDIKWKVEEYESTDKKIN